MRDLYERNKGGRLMLHLCWALGALFLLINAVFQRGICRHLLRHIPSYGYLSCVTIQDSTTVGGGMAPCPPLYTGLCVTGNGLFAPGLFAPG